MIKFGKQLEHYIKRRNLTIKSAAEMFGMDRATLHKILSGQRKLKNEQVLESISEALMLTSDEYSDLLKKYRIGLMGEDVFERRNKVSDVISYLSANEQNKVLLDYHMTEEDELEELPEVMVVNEHLALLKNISTLLMKERLEGGDILFIAQPSAMLNEIIFNVCTDEGSGSVKHIFCMDNNCSESCANEYNLDILKYVCKMSSLKQKYIPQYYYDNAAGCFSQGALLSDTIITEHFFIRLEKKFNEGVFCSNETAVKLYRQKAEVLESRSHAFLYPVEGFKSLIDYYYELNTLDYIYYYQPCMVFASPDDILRKYMRMPKEIEGTFLTKMGEFKSAAISRSVIDIFSEAGLKEFMETGLIAEVPDVLYERPALEDRKSILRSMIYLAESDIFRYRILKPELCSYEKGFHMHGTSELLKVSPAKNEPQNMTFVNIREKSILNAFKDYINYLIESDLTYSKSETIDILKKYL